MPTMGTTPASWTILFREGSIGSGKTLQLARRKTERGKSKLTGKLVE